MLFGIDEVDMALALVKHLRNGSKRKGFVFQELNMAKNTCAECGQDMGNGYDTDDICLDCYEINDAADEILHYIDRACPTMWKNVSHTARPNIRNTIKSTIRAHFL